MVLRRRLRRAFRKMIRRKRKVLRKRYWRRGVKTASFRKGIIQDQIFRKTFVWQTIDNGA